MPRRDTDESQTMSRPIVELLCFCPTYTEFCKSSCARRLPIPRQPGSRFDKPTVGTTTIVIDDSVPSQVYQNGPFTPLRRRKSGSCDTPPLRRLWIVQGRPHWTSVFPVNINGPCYMLVNGVQEHVEVGRSKGWQHVWS